MSEAVRTRIGGLLKEKYAGFGATLATEDMLQFRNMSTMEAAQAFLPLFMLKWNEKFAVEPSDKVTAHRPWTTTEDELDLLLARREERVLSKALTFSYGGTKYCVKTSGPGTAMRGAKVVVHHFADDRPRFSYKDRMLSCTAYATYAVADTAEDAKTLDARVDAIVAARRNRAGQVAAMAA